LLLAHEGERVKANEKLSSNIVRVVLVRVGVVNGRRFQDPEARELLLT
jgi:hypothetical protein